MSRARATAPRPRHVAAPEPDRTFLDWSDKVAVRRLLVEAKAKADDLDGLMQDMMRPYRERELGPAMVREVYEGAMGGLLSLLEYAVGPEGFPPLGKSPDAER